MPTTDYYKVGLKTRLQNILNARQLITYLKARAHRRLKREVERAKSRQRRTIKGEKERKTKLLAKSSAD